MTDLDTPFPDQPPESRSPGRPALWRVVSLAAVVATVVIVILAVFVARGAGNVLPADDDALSLDSTFVTIGELGAADPMRVQSLGLDPAHSVDVVSSGTDVVIPAAQPSLIGLRGSDESLIGLALVRTEADRSTVEISADSTARALLVLTPAVLRRDLSQAFAQVDLFADDPAFANLVAALAADSNLSRENPTAETALAQILDRVPRREPPADQGCDSVLDPQAYAAAGTCVQPGPDASTISNEQDRWALLYSSTGELCATIGPVRTAFSEVSATDDGCGTGALLVAPGAIVDLAGADPTVVDHVASAAAIQMLSSYVIPLADLAAGAAGLRMQSDAHIAENSAALVDILAEISIENPRFAAALATLFEPASAMEAHDAGIVAAQVLLAIPSAEGLIPGRAEGATGHLALLDFFTRTGERMIVTDTERRWTAAAVGEIALSEGAS